MNKGLKLGDGELSASEKAELDAYRRDFLQLVAEGRGETVDPGFAEVRVEDEDGAALEEIYGEGVTHARINDYSTTIGGKPRSDNAFGLTSDEPPLKSLETPDAFTYVRETLGSSSMPALVGEDDVTDSSGDLVGDSTHREDELFLDDDDLLTNDSPIIERTRVSHTNTDLEPIERSGDLREDV